MFVFQRRTHIDLFGCTTDLPDNTVSSEKTSYNYCLEIHYGVFHMSRRWVTVDVLYWHFLFGEFAELLEGFPILPFK